MNTFQFNFIKNVSNIVLHMLTNVSNDVADFIGCQFALESNYGNSNLAQQHCNYCGMKYARVRPRTSMPIVGSDFAEFSDFNSCVVDYFFALSFHRLETWDFENVQRFSAAIKKWYCPDKDYINKINSIYQSFKSYQNEK